MKPQSLTDLFPKLKRKKGFLLFLDPARENIWLDPDKEHKSHLDDIISSQDYVDSLVIGGSSDITSKLMSKAIKILVENGFPQHKIGLIPSHHTTLCSGARYVVMPFLLNSTINYFRLDFVLESIKMIEDLALIPVPTAYLLVEPADRLTVGKVTKPEIIRRTDFSTAKKYALSSQVMGLRTLSLEAGSGAYEPINPDLIKSFRDHFEGIITVGGGIKTPEQVESILRAGADVTIIGDSIEKCKQPKELIRTIYDVVSSF